MAVAKENRENPIAVIAVNSGSSLKKVSKYVRENKITIPVIADLDRTLEASAKIGEISLRNIYQARVLKADGKVVRGNARDIGKSVKTSLEGATWNIDPKIVPAKMMTLWQKIEFGNFAAAAKTLNRRLKSRKEDELAAATKMQKFVESQLSKNIQAAEKLQAADEHWNAWKSFYAITERYQGFKIPANVDAQLKTLVKIPEVKSQREAWKQLSKAEKLSTSNMKRARQLLKQLIEKHPNSEAAKTAEGYLSK